MAEKKFNLGQYEFDSYAEFRDGQQDIEKIDIIKKELDLTDPEAALRLYNMIREGKISFKTQVGRDFFLHVSDIVADRSQGMLEEKETLNNEISKVEKRYRFQKVLGTLLIGIACVAFVYVGYVEVRDYTYTNKLAKIQAQVAEANGEDPNSLQFANVGVSGDGTENGTDGEGGDSGENAETPLIDRATLTILPEYEDLYVVNSDLCGWIQIPDTDINYPVMQSMTDNDFYLDHDFYGEKDSNGTIFCDSRCDIVNQTTNTILYGHNMRSGMMFGSLKKYEKEKYLEEHPFIYFNTIYERRVYKIVAVCLSKVSYQDENTFRYYNYINCEEERQFDEFYSNITRLSVFDGVIDLEQDDKILTLSTCNNYTEDGRLFVVAKRVDK